MLGVCFSIWRMESGCGNWVKAQGMIYVMSSLDVTVRVFHLSWLAGFIIWSSNTFTHPEEQISQICQPSGGNTAFVVSYDHFLPYPLKCCRSCVKGQRGCFVCVTLQIRAIVSCLVLLIWGQKSSSNLLIYSIINYVILRWKIVLFLK